MDESSFAELESKVEHYLQRIDQIDRILTEPLRTLIAEADRARLDEAYTGEPPRLRQWLTETDILDSSYSRVASSLCIVTLQRFYNVRRRFPRLKDDFKDLASFVTTLSSRYLPENTGTQAQFFAACCSPLHSKLHGILNPITGAQVFRVLMETGEDRAHSGPGCASFFAMVWPLFREGDGGDPLDLGARIEPGRPTAYVTAKCILPLIQLQQICRKRARLTRQLADQLGQMYQEVRFNSPRSRWMFSITLNSLINTLFQLAPLSLGSERFRKLAEKLSDDSRTITEKSDLKALFEVVLVGLYKALVLIQSKNEKAIRDARGVLRELNTQLVMPLTEGTVPTIAGQDLGFAAPKASSSTSYIKYVKMLADAAGKATGLCATILDNLDRVSTLLPLEQNARSAESVEAALRALAHANEAVAKLVYGPVEVQARWCHAVTNREIAFTSANNDADFDPAELVSSIAVAARTNRFNTPEQLADAVGKAVLGVQRDGSWRLLHSFYSGDGSQGIRPPAADVVWTLASAISHFPEISVADGKLFQFVDWLERTRKTIPTHDDNEAGSYVGWSADQVREGRRINLMTTAYSANALLAIRDLVEHRLWELCKQRFTIVSDVQKLAGVDPVDLMAPHRKRLHSILAEINRNTQAEKADATYSLVLHGPPGSSKTAVASALANSLWSTSTYWDRQENQTRMIRVTPADFTRRGEAHVESEAHLIFRLLSRVRGVTILFDEIDDLLRRREDSKPRFLSLVIPAMLNRLQDLRDSCPSQEICFLFGTNYIERIEPALMRPGRIDRVLPVSYPDYASRLVIAERVFEQVFQSPKLHPLTGDLRMEWARKAMAAMPGTQWSDTTRALKYAAGKATPFLKANDGRDVEPTAWEQAERALLEHLPFASARKREESPLNEDYLRRLEGRPQSKELRVEVLYGLIAQSIGVPGDLGEYLEAEVRALTGVPEDGGTKGSSTDAQASRAVMFDRLKAAITDLPHFDGPVPDTRVSA